MKRKHLLTIIIIIISGIVLVPLEILFGSLTLKAVDLVGGWSADLAQGTIAVLNYRVPVWSLMLGIIASLSCLIGALRLMSLLRSGKTGRLPTTMDLGGAEINWRNVYSKGAITIKDIEILCPQCKISLDEIDPSYIVIGRTTPKPICSGCGRSFESCPNYTESVRKHINGFLRRGGFL